MQQLPTIDIAVLVIYMLGIVAFGCAFVRKSGNTSEFMAAGGSLPGWAVGLSIFGTYLSSNTFLGVPGKAYGSNWNSFVFSLSLPFAAVIAVKYFVPFYRRRGEISAYQHFEHRFGPWARTYCVICYLLTQIARVGSIMLGVALGLNALTGWGIAPIIIVSGVLVTLYTLLGGIEAVIWTDVAQSIILTIGAFLVAGMILFGMPEGPSQVFTIAAEHGKFSLGSTAPDFTTATILCVFIYGLFINLNNFGIDQNFVQRYHTAKSESEAGRAVWMGAFFYVPISLLFFFIGSSLFAYYEANPEMQNEVRIQVATANLEHKKGDLTPQEYETAKNALPKTAQELTAANIGDKIFPHFIANKLPTGMAGLLIAAICAAAMSSVDTSLNSSATVILTDVYKRYLNPDVDERGSMRVLYASTLAVGAVGTGIGVALIGTDSILDAWWKLSGIFAGGMLGLFLLSMIARKARRPAAMTGVIIGLLVITWMTVSDTKFLNETLKIPYSLPENLRSPLHSNMIIVVGTLTIFFVGLIASQLFGNGSNGIVEAEE